MAGFIASITGRPKLINVSFYMFFFLLTGCSRQARDKLLLTFIDGVPGHKEEKPIAKEEGKNKEVKTDTALPRTPIQFTHQPYVENQCSSCHDSKSSQRLTLQGNDLCFSCHDDFTKNKPVVHYPVKEGACIDCHDPHKSTHRAILKEAIPELCFSCHGETDILANPVHDTAKTCIVCHEPHVSEKEGLLR